MLNESDIAMEIDSAFQSRFRQTETGGGATVAAAVVFSGALH
jgi:hypothetical protein